MNPPKWFKDFAGAWIFYSVLPELPWPKAQFKRIARFAPLIGIFLGTVQSSTWWILHLNGWPTSACVLLVISLGIIITGGLHLDGLMDTADGIAAGEKHRLNAMEDSRIGAIGVQSLLVILFAQIGALIKLSDLAIIAIPISTFWGRLSHLIAITRFPYIKPNGSAEFHKKYFQPEIDFLPSIIGLTFFIILLLIYMKGVLKIKLLFCSLLGIIPAYLIQAYLGNKLGGHTGDSYGAAIVITETFIFLTMAIYL